jgi:hypothetical protein
MILENLFLKHIFLKKSTNYFFSGKISKKINYIFFQVKFPSVNKEISVPRVPRVLCVENVRMATGENWSPLAANNASPREK